MGVWLDEQIPVTSRITDLDALEGCLKKGGVSLTVMAANIDWSVSAD